MTRKNSLILRFISACLVAFFFLQDISYAAPLDTVSVGGIHELPLQIIAQDPTCFEAPLGFVTTKEVYKGTNGMFIIHIQDAHSNLSGQQNLAGALDDIMSRYHVSLILSEGGANDCSLTPLKKIASADIWKKIAKSYLMQGKISGEEYLNLVSDHPMKIMGIEDLGLYLTSVDNYGKLAGKREEILDYLKNIHRVLDKLKNRFYPKELLDYERQLASENFEKKFRDLLELISNLSLRGASATKQSDLQSGANQIASPRPPAADHARNDMLTTFPNLLKLKTLQTKEKEINFEAANLEQSVLVEEIFRQGGKEDLESHLKKMNEMKDQKVSQLAYFQNTLNIAKDKKIDTQKFTNLLLYLDYLKAFSEIDLDQLLDEMMKAEDRVYLNVIENNVGAGLPRPDVGRGNRAPTSDNVKDALLIRAIDRYVTLLDTAYHIQMTTKEFNLFKVNEPDFATIPYLAFLNRKLAEQGYFEDLIPYKNLLEEGKEALEEFYNSVDKRDVTFVQNTEKILKSENQKVAVLITGGYHTPHLKNLFKEKGYSYAVLTPIVTGATNQQKYEKRLLGPIQKETKKLELTQGESKSGDVSLGRLGSEFKLKKKSDGVREILVGMLYEKDGIISSIKPNDIKKLRQIRSAVDYNYALLKDMLYSAALDQATEGGADLTNAKKLANDNVQIILREMSNRGATSSSSRAQREISSRTPAPVVVGNAVPTSGVLGARLAEELLRVERLSFSDKVLITSRRQGLRFVFDIGDNSIRVYDENGYPVSLDSVRMIVAVNQFKSDILNPSNRESLEDFQNKILDNPTALGSLQQLSLETIAIGRLKVVASSDLTQVLTRNQLKSDLEVTLKLRQARTFVEISSILGIVDETVLNKILIEIEEKTDPLIAGNLSLFGSLQPIGFGNLKSESSTRAASLPPINAPSEKATTVLQREYSLESYKEGSSIRYLQTFGVGPCVAVTLWDEKTKTGVLTHIDGLTSISASFGEIFDKLSASNADMGNLKAAIVGGDSSTSPHTFSFIEKFLNLYKVEVIYKDVIKDYSQSVVLDLSDGKIYEVADTLSVKLPEKRLTDATNALLKQVATYEKGGQVEYEKLQYVEPISDSKRLENQGARLSQVQTGRPETSPAVAETVVSMGETIREGRIKALEDGLKAIRQNLDKKYDEIRKNPEYIERKQLYETIAPVVTAIVKNLENYLKAELQNKEVIIIKRYRAIEIVIMKTDQKKDSLYVKDHIYRPYWYRNGKWEGVRIIAYDPEKLGPDEMLKDFTVELTEGLSGQPQKDRTTLIERLIMLHLNIDVNAGYWEEIYGLNAELEKSDDEIRGLQLKEGEILAELEKLKSPTGARLAKVRKGTDLVYPQGIPVLITIKDNNERIVSQVVAELLQNGNIMIADRINTDNQTIISEKQSHLIEWQGLGIVEVGSTRIKKVGASELQGPRAIRIIHRENYIGNYTVTVDSAISQGRKGKPVSVSQPRSPKAKEETVLGPGLPEKSIVPPKFPVQFDGELVLQTSRYVFDLQPEINLELVIESRTQTNFKKFLSALVTFRKSKQIPLWESSLYAIVRFGIGNVRKELYSRKLLVGDRILIGSNPRKSEKFKNHELVDEPNDVLWKIDFPGLDLHRLQGILKVYSDRIEIKNNLPGQMYPITKKGNIGARLAVENASIKQVREKLHSDSFLGAIQTDDLNQALGKLLTNYAQQNRNYSAQDFLTYLQEISATAERETLNRTYEDAKTKAKLRMNKMVNEIEHPESRTKPLRNGFFTFNLNVTLRENLFGNPPQTDGFIRSLMSNFQNYDLFQNVVLTKGQTRVSFDENWKQLIESGSSVEEMHNFLIQYIPQIEKYINGLIFNSNSEVIVLDMTLEEAMRYLFKIAVDQVNAEQPFRQVMLTRQRAATEVLEVLGIDRKDIELERMRRKPDWDKFDLNMALQHALSNGARLAIKAPASLRRPTSFEAGARLAEGQKVFLIKKDEFQMLPVTEKEKSLIVVVYRNSAGELEKVGGVQTFTLGLTKGEKAIEIGMDYGTAASFAARVKPFTIGRQSFANVGIASSKNTRISREQMRVELVDGKIQLTHSGSQDTVMLLVLPRLLGLPEGEILSAENREGLITILKGYATRFNLERNGSFQLRKGQFIFEIFGTDKGFRLEPFLETEASARDLAGRSERAENLYHAVNQIRKNSDGKVYLNDQPIFDDKKGDLPAGFELDIEVRQSASGYQIIVDSNEDMGYRRNRPNGYQKPVITGPLVLEKFEKAAREIAKLLESYNYNILRGYAVPDDLKNFLDENKSAKDALEQILTPNLMDPRAFGRASDYLRNFFRPYGIAFEMVYNPADSKTVIFIGKVRDSRRVGYKGFQRVDFVEPFINTLGTSFKSPLHNDSVYVVVKPGQALSDWRVMEEAFHEMAHGYDFEGHHDSPSTNPLAISKRFSPTDSEFGVAALSMVQTLQYLLDQFINTRNESYKTQIKEALQEWFVNRVTLYLLESKDSPLKLKETGQEVNLDNVEGHHGSIYRYMQVLLNAMKGDELTRKNLEDFINEIKGIEDQNIVSFATQIIDPLKSELRQLYLFKADASIAENKRVPVYINKMDDYFLKIIMPEFSEYPAAPQAARSEAGARLAAEVRVKSVAGTQGARLAMQQIMGEGNPFDRGGLALSEQPAIQAGPDIEDIRRAIQTWIDETRKKKDKTNDFDEYRVTGSERATGALFEIGKAAVPLLIEVLENEDLSIRVSVLAILVGFGSQGVQDLIHVLKDQQRPIRQRVLVAQVLGQVVEAADTDIISLLNDIVNNEGVSIAIRGSVGRALQKITGKTPEIVLKAQVHFEGQIKALQASFEEKKESDILEASRIYSRGVADAIRDYFKAVGLENFITPFLLGSYSAGIAVPKESDIELFLFHDAEMNEDRAQIWNDFYSALKNSGLRVDDTPMSLPTPLALMELSMTRNGAETPAVDSDRLVLTPNMLERHLLSLSQSANEDQDFDIRVGALLLAKPLSSNSNQITAVGKILENFLKKNETLASAIIEARRRLRLELIDESDIPVYVGSFLDSTGVRDTKLGKRSTRTIASLLRMFSLSSVPKGEAQSLFLDSTIGTRENAYREFLISVNQESILQSLEISNLVDAQAAILKVRSNVKNQPSEKKAQEHMENILKIVKKLDTFFQKNTSSAEAILEESKSSGSAFGARLASGKWAELKPNPNDRSYPDRVQVAGITYAPISSTEKPVTNQTLIRLADMKTTLMGNQSLPYDFYNVVGLYMIEDALAQLKGRPFNVVDIGAGGGIMTLRLLAGGAEHVYAVELNPNALENLKASLRANGYDFREFKNFSDIPLVPGKYKVTIYEGSYQEFLKGLSESRLKVLRTAARPVFVTNLSVEETQRFYAEWNPLYEQSGLAAMNPLVISAGLISNFKQEDMNKSRNAFDKFVPHSMELAGYELPLIVSTYMGFIAKPKIGETLNPQGARLAEENSRNVMEGLVPVGVFDREKIVAHYASLPGRINGINSELYETVKRVQAMGFTTQISDVDKRNVRDVEKKLGIPYIMETVVKSLEDFQATQENPLRVLDIGAGKGIFLKDIYDQLSEVDRKRVHLVGVDPIPLEPSYVIDLKQRGIEWHQGLFEFQEISNYGNKGFHLVYGAEVLQYAYDPKTILDKTNSFLAERGQAVVGNTSGVENKIGYFIPVDGRVFLNKALAQSGNSAPQGARLAVGAGLPRPDVERGNRAPTIPIPAVSRDTVNNLATGELPETLLPNGTGFTELRLAPSDVSFITRPIKLLLARAIQSRTNLSNKPIDISRTSDEGEKEVIAFLQTELRGDEGIITFDFPEVNGVKADSVVLVIESYIMSEAKNAKPEAALQTKNFGEELQNSAAVQELIAPTMRSISLYRRIAPEAISQTNKVFAVPMPTDIDPSARETIQKSIQKYFDSIKPLFTSNAFLVFTSEQVLKEDGSLDILDPSVKLPSEKSIHVLAPPTKILQERAIKGKVGLIPMPKNMVNSQGVQTGPYMITFMLGDIFGVTPELGEEEVAAKASELFRNDRVQQILRMALGYKYSKLGVSEKMDLIKMMIRVDKEREQSFLDKVTFNILRPIPFDQIIAGARLVMQAIGAAA